MILNLIFFKNNTLKTFNTSKSSKFVVKVSKSIKFKEICLSYSKFINLYFYLAVIQNILTTLKTIKIKSFLFGSQFIFSLLIIFIFDAVFDGDEPIWEPLEWSLIQTFIIFLFFFSWVGENLITSRFGSFTGRDKRVWFAWYKSMWWIEMFYIVTLGITILLIIVPFYFQLTYASSFIMNFWNWFSKVFFFKMNLFFLIAISLSLLFQINIRFYHYKKNLFLVFLIVLLLNYSLFTQFYITFFSYFTDVMWYSKTKSNSLIQLSHEPWKWGWDLENRDHFQYHSSKTVFWFKTDGPFAESFFLINLFYFFSLLFVSVFWIILFRKIYNLKEVSFTYSLGAVSMLKQFFYFYLMFYLFIIACFVIIYLKFPFEFLWLINKSSFINHLILYVIH